MTEKLIENFERKNHRLSQLVIDSIEALDLWETVLALGKIRKLDNARWVKEES